MTDSHAPAPTGQSSTQPGPLSTPDPLPTLGFPTPSSSPSSSSPLTSTIQWDVHEEADTAAPDTQPLPPEPDEQAEKEATVDREERGLHSLSSSVVTSKPPSPSPSHPPPTSSPPPPPPSPPSPPTTTTPSLTRRASLFDTLDLDETALRELDALLTSPPPSSTPQPSHPPPDIESTPHPLPPSSSSPSPPFIPLSLFPLSILAVTSLSSQLWCEEQSHLSLTLGRRVSPSAQLAMDRGTARHDELEREVHDVVQVEVRGREEEWALRMLNGVVGLHELMMVGKTRELLVMARLKRGGGEGERGEGRRRQRGVVDAGGGGPHGAVWVMGVIDEVERIDNAAMEQRRQSEEDKVQEERRRAEERREKRAAKEEEDRRRAAEQVRLAEERRRAQSIKRHFAVVGKGEEEKEGGARGWVREGGVEDEEMLELLRSFEAMQEEEERRRAKEQEEMEAKGREEKRQRLAERAREARRQNRERMRMPPDTASFVISDNKTRAAKGLPSIAQQRTTRMQLSTYKWSTAQRSLYPSLSLTLLYSAV